MEEPQNNPDNKQKAPAMTINLTAGYSGGGIGGIIFLGGTLIVATLVSAIAFKRGRARRKQEDSPSTNKENHHSPPPSPTTMIYLPVPTNLEIMMKSSKDHHHHQVISKGLSFLLPADSPMPIVHKNPSSDAIAEKSATQIETTQALIWKNEKSKLEINGEKVDTTSGDEDIVLSEIHKETERTPLFDDSGLTVSGEKFSFPILDIPSLPSLEKVMESPNLEVESREVPKNCMGCDRETLFSSSPVLFIHENVMNKSEFLMEHPSISMKAVKSMEGDNEETNATPDDGYQVVVEEKEEMYDTIIQETIVEDEVQIVCDDQVVDEEKKEKVCEDQDTIKNCDEENIGVAKEGEPIKLTCDHVIVGEDKPEMQLVGQKQEEVPAMEVTKEQNRVESVCVDQIEVEDIMEVELIGKEEREDSAESSNEKHEEESVETAAHAADQIAEEVDQQMQLDEDKQACGDDNGREISTEAHTDQVAEENDKEVSMTDSQEATINRDEEGLQSDNMISIPMPTEATETMNEDGDSIKAGSLDHTEGEEKPDVKLIIEEECDGDVVTNKCEYVSIETADADELGESLPNNLQPEKANENNNPEKDPLSAEADNMDEVSEVASVDQVRVEDTVPNQLTETAAIAEETVEKSWVEENPQMELSENEEADDGEYNYEDEDDNNAEKGEDSSEGTGDSSMESNSDAIWPAESTLKLASEFNEVLISNLKMEEELANLFPSEESGDVVNGRDDNVNEDEILQRYEAVINQLNQLSNQLKQLSMEPWNLRTWTQSMFVSLWCLCHWYLSLPFAKVSLIAIILSIVVFCGFSSHVLASQK